ncbi:MULTISPECIES: hypothetical protein [Pedobacter]|uniref:Uncharacterized protein n=1 Tax=Pedobacter zeae TaxID=1737356 RepID=A0A7W6P5U3_9SPHI|nr:hypothetical protein [Pedobacter zeae]MBB4108397.1 hypothetical protein [Pedobacter zeae]
MNYLLKISKNSIILLQKGYTPKSKPDAMNMMALSLSKRDTIYDIAGKSLT